MMKNKKNILLWIVISATLLYLGIKNIKSSVVLKQNDRLNVVVYSATPVFYSLAFNDISYFIPFQADYETIIPGGYGTYRLGALGKLAYLEKKPELIKKTFSSVTSSFVDVYFYPKSAQVYYGSTAEPSVFPSPRDILFSVSNASWIDRIVLLVMFSNRNKNQYKLINNLPIRKEGNVFYFDRKVFMKTYQGFLYEKTYRDLSETVQIRYVKNYNTALLISQILEGEGIRVVDISEGSTNANRCVIIQKGNLGKTVEAIATHLGCTSENGKTDISDIILSLGSLEEEWSSN